MFLALHHTSDIPDQSHFGIVREQIPFKTENIICGRIQGQNLVTQSIKCSQIIVSKERWSSRCECHLRHLECQPLTYSEFAEDFFFPLFASYRLETHWFYWIATKNALNNESMYLLSKAALNVSAVKSPSLAILVQSLDDCITAITQFILLESPFRKLHCIVRLFGFLFWPSSDSCLQIVNLETGQCLGHVLHAHCNSALFDPAFSSLAGSWFGCRLSCRSWPCSPGLWPGEDNEAMISPLTEEL